MGEKNPGWWYTYPSQNMSSSVGIIIPNWVEKWSMFQTTKQIMMFFAAKV